MPVAPTTPTLYCFNLHLLQEAVKKQPESVCNHHTTNFMIRHYFCLLNEKKPVDKPANFDV